MPKKISKRTAARIIAIQSMYSYDFIEKIDIEGALSIVESVEDYAITDYSTSLLNTLLEQVIKHYDKFNDIVAQHINKNWTIDRIDLITLIILRTATYELTYCPDISTNIIIDEYTTITSYFSTNQEVNFVNAILDKISSHLRIKTNDQETTQ